MLIGGAGGADVPWLPCGGHAAAHIRDGADGVPQHVEHAPGPVGRAAGAERRRQVVQRAPSPALLRDSIRSRQRHSHRSAQSFISFGRIEAFLWIFLFFCKFDAKLRDILASQENLNYIYRALFHHK